MNLELGAAKVVADVVVVAVVVVVVADVVAVVHWINIDF